MNGQGFVISQQFWSKRQWMMFTCTYPWCLVTSRQCYMILFPSSFPVRNVTTIWVQLKSSTKSWMFFKLKMIWMTLFVLNKTHFCLTHTYLLTHGQQSNQEHELVYKHSKYDPHSWHLWLCMTSRIRTCSTGNKSPITSKHSSLQLNQNLPVHSVCRPYGYLMHKICPLLFSQ